MATATTQFYTLSLHDALPICGEIFPRSLCRRCRRRCREVDRHSGTCRRFDCLFFELAASFCKRDRKSTRLNSSHANISYAVFCLKKKKSHEEQPGALLFCWQR